MRVATSFTDLEDTRAAFDSWRSTRQGRRRIPEHLWLAAVRLLDRYPLTRTARELRLNSTELRKRQLAPQPLIGEITSTTPQFVEVPAADFSDHVSASPKTAAATERQFAIAPLRLQIERADGNRLTLSLPSSEWSRVEVLWSSFLTS